MNTLIRFLKKIKIIFLLSLLFSCSKEDVPKTGENSFITKVDGKLFVPHDIQKFATKSYGINASLVKDSWVLDFSNEKGIDIYIFLYKVDGAGKYKIGTLDNDFSFFSSTDDHTQMGISSGTGKLNDVAYGSTSNFDQYVDIKTVQGDSILIGSFDKIILENPDNSNDKTMLTEGKFNINLNTLNKVDPID